MAKKKNIGSSPLGKLAPEILQELQDKLSRERMLILQRISHANSSLVSNRQPGEEMADVGSENFLRETALSTLASEQKKLLMIEQALENMQSKDFGICNDCSQEIGLARLRAKPYAKLCVNCKSIREEHGGMHPDEIGKN